MSHRSLEHDVLRPTIAYGSISFREQPILMVRHEVSRTPHKSAEFYLQTFTSVFILLGGLPVITFL
jgi:hypothetical protein